MQTAANIQIEQADDLGLKRIAFILRYMEKTVLEQKDDSPHLILYVQYYRILVIELKCTKDEFDIMIQEYPDAA